MDDSIHWQEFLAFMQNSERMGDLNARLELGRLAYFGGRGAPVDPETARRNFVSVAEADAEKLMGQNKLLAQLGAAHMLAEGIGGEKNIERASEFLRDAVANKQPNAESIDAVLCVDGTPISPGTAFRCCWFFF